MSKRVCYIHVGPHKGTTSIQWFLRENRAELLKYGYFVPETGNVNGGHDPLARQLCGQEVPQQHRPLQNLWRHLPARYAKQSLFRLNRWKDFEDARVRQCIL
jgi:hypothetical protein